MNTTVLGKIAHDNGWLVIRFEQRLDCTQRAAWKALTASEHRRCWIRCGIPSQSGDGITVESPFRPAGIEQMDNGDPVFTGVTSTSQEPTVLEWCSDARRVRWEVDSVGKWTQLALIAWVDGGDVEAAASAGVDFQLCFEQLVRVLETGIVSADTSCEHSDSLATRYRAAMAAALADTD